MIVQDYRFWGRYFFDKLVRSKLACRYPLKGEEVLDWDDMSHTQQEPYIKMAREVGNELDLKIDKVLPF